MLMNKKDIIFATLMGALFTATFLGYITIILDVDKTIVAGMIGFVGALIGGGLTLIGVLITVNSNQRLREKNDLPKKLHNLEIIISKMTNILNEEFEFQVTEKQETHFIYMSSDYEVHYYERLDEYTKFKVDKFKDNVMFIDAEAYREFLRFKDDINELKERIFKEVFRRSYEFREEVMYLLSLKEEDLVGGINLMPLLKDKHRSVISLMTDKDNEFKSLLKLQYGLYLSWLNTKHKKMINEMNY